MEQPTLMPRAERARRFGIDCVDAVVFADWEPGGEYRKRLILKNVLHRAQTVKFSSPKSTVFSLPFPAPVHLSQGLATTIEVVFRPLELVRSEALVEVETKQGTFVVPLVAQIPQRDVALSDSLDFGFCPVGEPTTKPLLMANTGQLPVKYSIECTAPFSVSPSEGVTTPGQQIAVTVTFLPQEAIVLVGSIVAHIEGLPPRTIRLSGIGKYPHLAVSRISGATTAAMTAARMPDATVVDFGDVPASTATSKTVTLHNASLVRASVSVRCVGQESGAFVVRPVKAVVPAEGDADLKIDFTPPASDAFVADTYEISTPAGVSLRLRCAGRGAPPPVTLQPALLDFGDVKLGQRTTQTLTLASEAPQPVQWQLASYDGVFRAEPSHGVLSARSSLTISITFAPSLPINYHQRFFVLLRDREPLRCDAVATGFDEAHRPLPFDARVLDKARPWHPSAFAEYYVDDDDEHNQYRLTPAYASLDGVGSTHELLLTNSSGAKVTVDWTPPAPFVVQPASGDVAPGSTGRFSLSFSAPRGGTFLGTVVEAFVYPKTQRNFRLVDPASFVPPVRVAVQAVASTFSSAGGVPFVPKAALDPTTLHFPPAAPGACSYTTAVLTNNDDTPLLYAATVTAGDESVFSVKPRTAVIPPRKFQVLVFRFRPTAARVWQASMRIALNANGGDPFHVQLSGDAVLPELELDNEGRVFFKPTAAGTTSTRTVVLRNRSRVDAAFRWRVPAALSSRVAVAPPEGIVRGGDACVLTFSFTSQGVGLLNHTVPLYARAVGAPLDSERRAAVAIVRGEGRAGAVLLEPADALDFGPVLVGAPATRTVTLRNTSDCNMCFALLPSHVHAAGSDVQAEGALLDLLHEGETTLPVTSVPAADQPSLEAHPPRGVVPARDSVQVQVVLRMTRPGRAQFTLGLYVEAGKADVPLAAPIARPATHASLATLGDMSSAASATSTAMSTRPLPAVHSADLLVRGQALRPRLTVADAASPRFSRARLWGMIWGDDLNRELAAPVSAAEEELSRAKTFDSKRAELERKLPCVPINFSADSQGAEDGRIILQLHNPGPLPADWLLQMAGDEQAEMERWAAPSEPTREELDQATIINDRIFQAQPSRGRLEPGARLTVTLRYRHTVVGAHRLPALLRIRHGKQMVLALTGATLRPGEPFLYFNSNHVYLRPVPVGVERPPLQVLTLHNDGSGAANYSIDISALRQMAADSHGVPVMRCLQPTGTVPAGGQLDVPWLFQPLEVREYVAAVTVAVRGAASSLLAVHGAGYDASQESAPPPQLLDDTALPPRQPVLSEALPAGLATDVVDFGEVPTHAEARRMLVLRNRSAWPLQFVWQSAGPLAHVVRFEPSAGQLLPGEAASVQAILLSHIARIIDADFHCFVSRADGQPFPSAPNAAGGAGDGTERSHGSAAHTLGSRTAGSGTGLRSGGGGGGTRTSGLPRLGTSPHRSVVGVHTQSSALRFGAAPPAPTSPTRARASGTLGTAGPATAALLGGGGGCGGGSIGLLSRSEIGSQGDVAASPPSQPLYAVTLVAHVRASLLDMRRQPAHYPLLATPLVPPAGVRLPLAAAPAVQSLVGGLVLAALQRATRDAFEVALQARAEPPPLWWQFRDRSRPDESVQRLEQDAVQRRQAAHSAQMACVATDYVQRALAAVLSDVLCERMDVAAVASRSGRSGSPPRRSDLSHM